MHPGSRVLELGSAPGGWTQVIVDATNSKPGNPMILAIDRDHMDPVIGSKFVKIDIQSPETKEIIKEFFKQDAVDVVRLVSLKRWPYHSPPNDDF